MDLLFMSRLTKQDKLKVNPKKIFIKNLMNMRVLYKVKEDMDYSNI